MLDSTEQDNLVVSNGTCTEPLPLQNPSNTSTARSTTLPRGALTIDEAMTKAGGFGRY